MSELLSSLMDERERASVAQGLVSSPAWTRFCREIEQDLARRFIGNTDPQKDIELIRDRDGYRQFRQRVNAAAGSSVSVERKIAEAEVTEKRKRGKAADAA